LGQAQLAGLLKFLVVDNNGGMVISHTVKELALGHTQPLFTLSLGTEGLFIVIVVSTCR